MALQKEKEKERAENHAKHAAEDKRKYYVVIISAQCISIS